jgi:uncharacterized protein (TIGR02271 family)
MKESAMHALRSEVVRDRDGVCGTVIPAASPSPGTASQVTVQLEGGARVLVSVADLVQQPDGSYYLPLRLAELARVDNASHVSRDTPLVVPVIVEEPDIQKRVVETGKVRVTKVVHEREAIVDEPVWHDAVEVTRVPVQRMVSGPVSVRYEDDTMIVPVLEEVLVVEKRLMLKEELHIRKQRRETRQPQHITLRSEEARVERLNNTEQLHNTEQ